MGFEERCEINPIPHHPSGHRKEPRETVRPARHLTLPAHQDVEQQRSPELPANRLLAVAEEVADLKVCLSCLKKISMPQRA